MRIPIKVPRPGPSKPPCGYPQSHATRNDIDTELDGVAASAAGCTSIRLDTVEGMSNDALNTEGDDHHQGLARTHKLSDGSIYFFLSHAETDPGDKGSISQYRYAGPTAGEHVLNTEPLTVAPMKELLPLDGQHPSDITFLPDVNGLDAGYLFVTEEDLRRLTIYRWAPGDDLAFQGQIRQFPEKGPNFVFVDNVDGTYYLGIASNNWGFGKLFTAGESDLFPTCVQGSLNLSAFPSLSAATQFSFPLVESPSQCKLGRDATGRWSLLGFRSYPDHSEYGTDYVDVYDVSFSPFLISPRRRQVHVTFKPGDTGFANTGTHHVESSGRLLVSSSYRWANDEDPVAGFVSRVDELPSA